MTKYPKLLWGCILLGATTSAPADSRQGDSGVLAGLRQCRALMDATARLDCYDRQADALQTRFGDKELAIVDRAAVNPRATVLADADGVEVKSKDTSVVSAGRSADNRLTFTAGDGSAWVQTDDFPLFGIKPGRAVTLKRGALGSIFAVFAGTVPVRVKRVAPAAR